MGILERLFLGRAANERADAAKARLEKTCSDFDAARADFQEARARLLQSITKPPPRPASMPDTGEDWNE